MAHPVSGLSILAGYGYNDSRYTKADDGLTGKYRQGTPQHSANFWIHYQLQSGAMKGLGLGIGANAVSDCYYNDVNTVTLNGYAVGNAALSYNRQAFRLGIALNNITNKQYWMAGYYLVPQPPRHVTFSIAYRF